MSPTQQERADAFLAAHRGPSPLLMPNAFDAGSAKLLASLGFEAIATTSSGHAGTLGRRDGGVTRDEALAHAQQLVEAVELPVSADLEDCFADDPDGVAETVAGAVAAGLAGCSVEDNAPRHEEPVHELGLARARVEAAADAAHRGATRIVLTARAENFIRGRPDLADTITRLQAYQEAGADVLFAPGVVDPGDLRTLLAAVDRPVSVLVRPGAPTVAELGALGVARISVGGGLFYAAMGAVVAAATELRDHGTVGFWDGAGPGMAAARAAFS